MMTIKQEQHITDYLIEKKLPLDILLEVKDHMISQVYDIQINENLTFEEAFLKIKDSWKSEFEMTRYIGFYSEKIPVIAKKIIKGKYNGILKKSVLIALISFAVNLLFIYWSDSPKMYSILFRLQNSLFLVVPVLIWLFNYKIRKYLKQDFKYKGKLFYTIYQQNMGLFVGSIIMMCQIINADGMNAYLFFRTNDSVGIITASITLLMPFLAQIIATFGVFNLLEHKKTLIKLQNFLNPTTDS